MFIFMRLDALTIAKDGTLMNFEMQNERKACMEQRLRMHESSINLSYLAKEDIGELGDIIHGFGCWDYREMRYFKTTKEGRMGYGGEIDGYINEGKEIGLESSIKPLITNRLLIKEQIAKVYWG